MATRIFLCNRTDNSSINDLIKEAICSINKGYPYRVFWECGDIKTVKTGDAVFFKRTQDKPLGYFASGVVVAAHPEEQLRFQQDLYKNLDTCYSGIDEGNGNFYVDIEWNSCVDFEEPLRADLLKADHRFSGAYFDHRESGGSFKEEYVWLLAEFWDKHIEKLIGHRKGASLKATTPSSIQEKKEPESAISILSGAGFGNSDSNRDVEQIAIETVTAQYKQQGWHVESVERIKCGYDLRCVKEGKQEDVEVKGISGTDLSFILTAGELSQAEQNSNFVLWAVTSAQSKDKHLHQWSGIELLKSFNFNPIAFKAKLKEL